MPHPLSYLGQTIQLDRRKFLGAAAGLIATGVLPKSVLALSGPHTFKHGTFDITVVSDGNLTLPLAIVSPDAKPEELQQLLGLAADVDKISAELSPVLVRSASDLILFDAGTGPAMGNPTSGQIADSLKAAGLTADAVTKVVYTHAHPDHLWGTLNKDNAINFPNASFHMSEAEWNFWSAPDLASKMPKEMEGMVKGTQGQLAAIKEKMQMFKPGSELLPGINIIDTSGHTPGHVSFEFAGGDGLILVGDAITVPQVFFARPDLKFGFDADVASASKSRRMLLAMASAGKKQMLGYHWPYPGLARAEAKDGAYVYVKG
jgi:glyoxylase-like metal-dependent hydrolase (beta-lactamase superfamily II)